MAHIVLYKQVIDEIIQIARAGKPYETCGLIAKSPAGECVGQWPVPSIQPSPISFTMEPQAQITAMMTFEAQGLEWAGIWHSHPDGPAYPSQIDVGQSVNWPGIFMLILSLCDPEVTYGAFRVTSGKVERLGIQLVDKENN